MGEDREISDRRLDHFTVSFPSPVSNQSRDIRFRKVCEHLHQDPQLGWLHPESVVLAENEDPTETSAPRGRGEATEAFAECAGGLSRAGGGATRTGQAGKGSLSLGLRPWKRVLDK